MSIILQIDSSDRDRIVVKLVEEKRGVSRVLQMLIRASRNGHSETILPTIQTLLRRAKKTVKDIGRIAVVEGPGPFTAVRVGVVVANALAWSLGVPVHGITKQDFFSNSSLARRGGVRWHGKGRTFRPVMPKYGGEPNITIAKS